MREALHASDAKIIYVCNAMTKRGETTNMEVLLPVAMATAASDTATALPMAPTAP